MNLCTRTKFLRSNLVGSLCRFSTTVPEVSEQTEDFVDNSEEAQAREAEIERKRNKSGLSVAHHKLIHGRRPYEEPKMLAHLTVKYNRKIYGKYGMASGINPSLCWPTKDEVKEKLDYESVAYPFTIPEMMKSVAQQRSEEQQKIQQRDAEVAAKFAKLEQWKKDLSDRINRKAKEAQAAKEKKERLVEEVRRHFGFTLDPRDERFQEMLTKREKEQKKLEKKARIEAKEKAVIAKLQQKNVEVPTNTEKES